MKMICAGCGIGWTEGKGWDSPHNNEPVMCVNDRYGWLWVVEAPDFSELATPTQNEQQRTQSEYDAND